MKVLFMISNAGFPMKLDGEMYNPMPVVGGFILKDEPKKREICDSLGLTYVVKDISEVEFPVIEEVNEE